jgi:biotin carboxyl carrier protein
MADLTAREQRPAGDDGVRVQTARAVRDKEEPGLRVAVRAQRQVVVDGVPVDVELRDVGGGRHLLRRGDDVTRVVLEAPRHQGRGPGVREVLVAGFRFELEVEPERRAALRERATRGRATGTSDGPLEVRSVIAGRVAAVSVAAGDAVTTGQQLLVVEAMKMQNELRAPRGGTIERLGVAEGVNIEVGDLLLVIGNGRHG